jgi:ABC-type ATPase involved in cell division
LSDILSLEQVGLKGKDLRGNRTLQDISFSLREGEIVLVHSDYDNEDVPYIDLVTGLLRPDTGRVVFKGKDWAAGMSYHAQFRARSRIGSLARQHVWLSNQTVVRNVILSQRHHTSRPEVDLEKEADALAREVGLSRIPRVRPDAVSARELRMAGWVRAFMGSPDLVVLLFPERDAMAEWPAFLDAMLGTYMAKGGAAFVVSDNPSLWQLSVMGSARHYGFREGKWLELSSKM